MLSTDRALYTGRCPILTRSHNWPEKYVVVIQNAILFFDKFQSYYDSDGLKFPTIDLQAFPLVIDGDQERETKNLHQEEKNILKLVDVAQKRARLIAFPTKAHMKAFKTAVTASSYYAVYEALCNEMHVEPHPYILRYIVDLVQNPKAPFCFKEIFLQDDYFLPIYEFLKKNKLITNMVFQDQVLDDKSAKVALQLITNFPRRQITHLTFKNNYLADEILDIILFGLSHQAFLEYLEISSNLLTDQAIPMLTSIFEHMPSLKHLNISGNQIAGLKDFSLFLEAILRDLQLKVLDLSNNKLKDSTIDLFISYIFKQPELSIIEFNISRNDFSNLGLHRLFDSYYRCPNKEKMKLLLKPLPFHSGILSKLLGNDKTIDVTLERISLNNLVKRPPSRSSEFQNIYEILQKIDEFKGASITIEEMARICNKIYHLEYEFPPQKLELVYFVLRKKIQQALTESNYYATETLLKAAQQVGLGIQEFEEELKHARYKVAKVVTDLIDILNFEVPEAELNELLDKKLQEALKLGLRGYLIDTLLCLKEKRDEMIKSFHKEGYEEETENDDENPFAVLERDSEYAGVKSGIEIDLLRIDKCLVLHPAQANYYDLSRMSITRLQEILKTTIARLKDEENYYIRNAYNRCYFLLLTSVENGRSFAKKDKKLYNCRLIIQYRNYVHKKIDKQAPPIPIIYSVDKIQIPDNLKDILEQYKMQKFPYLRSYEEVIKKYTRSHSEQSASNTTATERPDKRESLISFTRGSKEGHPPRKETLLKPALSPDIAAGNILDYSAELFPYSIIKFSNRDITEVPHIINSNIFKIMQNGDEYVSTIQNLIKIMQGQDPTKYYELNDEMYLQFYKMTNTAVNSQNVQNIYVAFTVISIFILPEPELMEYVKAWMYSLVNDPAVGLYVRKILLNLLNASLPKFNKPYWLPSRKEIKDLLKNDNKISVDVKLQAGYLTTKSFTLPHTCTVQYLMDQIYALPHVIEHEDKYAFWLYKSNDSVKGTEDIALPREAILAEVMSLWGETNDHVYSLLVKRRVFCSAFTLNCQHIQARYLESLYEDTLHKISHCFAFAEYLKIDSVVKTGAILYLIRQRRKDKDKLEINEAKITKALPDLISKNYMMKKTEQEWKERIVANLNYNLKWLELDLISLYKEFLSVFTASPIFAGSYFSYKKKDNIADRSIPIEGIFCVNVFGMFFFSQSQRDKPSYSLNFEDISYAIGYENTCKIAYIDKKFGTEVNATLETPRARELVEDIMSYAYVRNLEKNYVFYSFPIIQDFEKIYANRRTGKVETQLELPEEVLSRVEEEIEINEVIKIPNQNMAFHEKLPFFEEEKPILQARARKIQREVVQDDGMQAGSIENLDGNNSRQNSYSESRRSSHLLTHAATSIKEERKGVFGNLFGFVVDGFTPIAGIFRKEKGQQHSDRMRSDTSLNDLSKSPEIMPMRAPALVRNLSTDAALSLDLESSQPDEDRSARSYTHSAVDFEKKIMREDLQKKELPKSLFVPRAEAQEEKAKTHYNWANVKNTEETKNEQQPFVPFDILKPKKRETTFDVVREELEDSEDSASEVSLLTPPKNKMKETVVKKEESFQGDGGVRELIKARRRANAVSLSKSPFRDTGKTASGEKVPPISSKGFARFSKDSQSSPDNKDDEDLLPRTKKVTAYFGPSGLNLDKVKDKTPPPKEEKSSEEEESEDSEEERRKAKVRSFMTRYKNPGTVVRSEEQPSKQNSNSESVKEDSKKAKEETNKEKEKEKPVLNRTASKFLTFGPTLKPGFQPVEEKREDGNKEGGTDFTWQQNMNVTDPGGKPRYEDTEKDQNTTSIENLGNFQNDEKDKPSPSKLGVALTSALRSMPGARKNAREKSNEEGSHSLIDLDQSKGNSKNEVETKGGEGKSMESLGKEEVKKSDSKEKLGKALSGALKSMPKVKKIEKPTGGDTF